MPTETSEELRSEIAQLEAELNAVAALTSVSKPQSDALRERLRRLKEKAGV